MNTVMVRYTTRDDRVAENEDLIRAVFDELRDTAPAGLRYAAFRLADSSTFVHVATIDTTVGVNPLTTIGSFKRFQHGLSERCTTPPVAADLVAVDSYGLAPTQPVTSTSP